MQLCAHYAKELQRERAAILPRGLWQETEGVENLEEGMENLLDMTYTCNPSAQEAETEAHELKTSLGYVVRPYLKNDKRAADIA